MLWVSLPLSGGSMWPTIGTPGSMERTSQTGQSNSCHVLLSSSIAKVPGGRAGNGCQAGSLALVRLLAAGRSPVLFCGFIWWGMLWEQVERQGKSKRELSNHSSPYPAGPGWQSLSGLQLAVGRLQVTPSSVLFPSRGNQHKYRVFCCDSNTNQTT